MAWTDEQKQKVIDMYTEKNPTPETSTEIIREIADELDLSPNGIRMVLIQANVYVKKDPSAGKTSGTSSKSEGSKRVSKEASINSLRELIEKRGAPVDDEILDKLTGKAAVYLASVINAI